MFFVYIFKSLKEGGQNFNLFLNNNIWLLMYHNVFIIYDKITLSVLVLLYLEINYYYNVCTYFYIKYKTMCILIENVFCFVFITIFLQKVDNTVMMVFNIFF